MRVRYSYLPQQFARSEAILEAIRQHVTTCQFTLGPEVEQFERSFASLIGARYAIGVGSGTEALTLSLRALGIGHGDEVITAANTFIATVGAINAAGARPVLVDVTPYYTMDPTRLAAAITVRTKAIIPVHLTGEVADMDDILAIAARHGVAVVEDACQAIGAQYRGRTAGTMGILGAFSLHPLKNLNVWGDAGVIVTNDAHLDERLRLLRNHGLKHRDEIELLGYNSRLDSIQAIVGNWLINQVQDITSARIANADRYDAALQQLQGAITLPPRRPDVRRVFHLYQIYAQERDQLFQYLLEEGIEAKIHYPIPLPLQRGLAHLGYRPGDFPATERQAASVITLPVDQHLTSEEMAYVIQRVSAFYQRKEAGMTPTVTGEIPCHIRIPYTDVAAQGAADREHILAAIERVVLRGDFILGQDVEAFEREFAALCRVRYAVGVANGTDALILALRAAGIGPGDEVITAPNSWISSASSIALVGARPVFADVGDDFLLDPLQVEAAITPRTKAILPVHLTGRCADMDALGAIAARHGLMLIEDAAQAAGASWAGRPAGSFGVMGCFSLHPLKNLSGMGDGGVITTNDEALAARLRLLRNHGLRTRDEVVTWGWNSRLDTVQAAILRCRLRTLDQVTAVRRRHAAHYQQRLSSVVTCPVDRPADFAIYHLFMIQCEAREGLRQFLAERGIDTRIHYPTPIHLQPCCASLGYHAGDFPVAEQQARRILSLPVHQQLTDGDIEDVAQAVMAFGRRTG